MRASTLATSKSPFHQARTAPERYLNAAEAQLRWAAMTSHNSRDLLLHAPHTGTVDRSRVQILIRELLEAIGENPNRDGLLDTPRRVADMYVELFEGSEADPGEHLRVTFESDHDEMVMVRDIPFTSLCEHHLVPFKGLAHVAYLPGPEGRITGLSKMARLVEGYARRLQVQERMTTAIVEAMERELHPKGTIVVIEAEHFCMSMRGVKKAGSTTVTSAVRGVFRDDASYRAEALQYIHQRRSAWR